MSVGFNLSCEVTKALAGVPTGSTNANEQDNVTGIKNSKGFLPRLEACDEV